MDAWRDMAVVSGKKKLNAEETLLVYCHHTDVRKQKRPILQGLGNVSTLEVYTRRWFGYEAFRFLDDRDKPRPRMDTEPVVVIEGDPIQQHMDIQKDDTEFAQPSAPKRTNRRQQASKMGSYSTRVGVQHAVCDILMKTDRGLFAKPTFNYGPDHAFHSTEPDNSFPHMYMQQPSPHPIAPYLHSQRPLLPHLPLSSPSSRPPTLLNLDEQETTLSSVSARDCALVQLPLIFSCNTSTNAAQTSGTISPIACFETRKTYCMLVYESLVAKNGDVTANHKLIDIDSYIAAHKQNMVLVIHVRVSFRWIDSCAVRARVPQYCSAHYVQCAFDVALQPRRTSVHASLELTPALLHLDRAEYVMFHSQRRDRSGSREGPDDAGERQRRVPDDNSTVCVLTSHQGEPGLIPGRVTGISHVGIMLGDTTGRWVFSGISRFLRPFIPAPLHTHLIHPHR
ncbi:hypothetical protein PR048_024228 [Dryococelus australis]|uniref:Uncharacterized protein n=1 Tax=Dryococelus australis TaxID=614101 RepID=A0ABQ9GN32_9NEOP|nr:hypothetical protein PR048_024228 [Dryococelus australis]